MIKQVQDEIKELRGLIDSGLKAVGRQILSVEKKLSRLEDTTMECTVALAARVEGLEVPRKRRVSRPMKTQSSIVKALQGGKMLTVKQLAAELELSDSAIRNGVAQLKKRDLITVEKELVRTRDRACYISIVHLK